jgi:hypothetical protein
VKVIIYSEDHPNGQTVDWPALPPIGGYVRFAHRGGTSNLEVKSIDFNVDTDGNFEHAEVNLSY